MHWLSILSSSMLSSPCAVYTQINNHDPRGHRANPHNSFAADRWSTFGPQLFNLYLSYLFSSFASISPKWTLLIALICLVTFFCGLLWATVRIFKFMKAKLPTLKLLIHRWDCDKKIYFKMLFTGWQFQFFNSIQKKHNPLLDNNLLLINLITRTQLEIG